MKKMKRFVLFLLASVILVGCSYDDPSLILAEALKREAREKQEQSVQPGIEFRSEFDAAPVVPGESAETPIYFKSNLEWKAETTSSWFSISPKSGKSGDGSVVIKTLANEEFDSRSGKITFTSGYKTFTITVVQSQKSAIIVEKDSFDVGKNGGDVTVVVKTTVEFETVVPRDYSDWICVEPYTKALKTKYVQLNIAANPGAERTGYVDLVNKEKGLSKRVTINQEAGGIPVADVTLDKATLEITVGDVEKLTATVAPDDATDKTVRWTSDNEEVATVDEEGNVQALATGTANITVTTTDGGFTATCAVTVTLLYEWDLLGTGFFTDDTALPLYGFDPVTVPVKVYQEKTNKGLYKISDHALQIACAAFGTTEEEMRKYEGVNWRNADIILDASNPASVIWELQDYGVCLNPDEGFIDGVTNMYQGAPFSKGVFSNGVISWPTPKGMLCTINGDGYYRADLNGKQAIILPSAVTAEKLEAGKFTVNAEGKQVHFSQGNLQATYNSTGNSYTWGFAANQYDYIGIAGNTTIDSQTDGAVVDLFGWSTESTNYGISTSWNEDGNDDYSGEFVDWGEAIISDGNTWRTLSTAEWQYLINKNNDENIRKGKYKCGVTVCEKTGCLILAPDDFEGEIATSYDAAAWASAEAAGLVCLPAAGLRFGSGVTHTGGSGDYWSSSAKDEGSAYEVNFYDKVVTPVLTPADVFPASSANRCDGYSVRLVTDVK